jgi:hypothetical protein
MEKKIVILLVKEQPLILSEKLSDTVAKQKKKKN